MICCDSRDANYDAGAIRSGKWPDQSHFHHSSVWRVESLHQMAQQGPKCFALMRRATDKRLHGHGLCPHWMQTDKCLWHRRALIIFILIHNSHRGSGEIAINKSFRLRDSIPIRRRSANTPFHEWMTECARLAFAPDQQRYKPIFFLCISLAQT